jgi:hypothetical protein
MQITLSLPTDHLTLAFLTQVVSFINVHLFNKLHTCMPIIFENAYS